jgi:DNA (cytosine-5)-methyltransferase 1
LKKPSRKIIKMADLFCGAGGFSKGGETALKQLGFTVELTAINHWEIAIATHSANLPGARHFCQSLETLNPRELFAEGELDILCASPECTHHSVARGGKPINDQSRSTAWCVIRWAEAIRPRIILVENVKEFRTWGPIGSNGRPLKSKKGEIFNQWIKCLEACGYKVEHRVVRSADVGDPTTRERLIVMAVRGNLKCVWPNPTHSKVSAADLFTSNLPTWKSARNHVIDWKVPGKSIYSRKKPLSPKTMRRIMIGLQKFGLKPFTLSAGGPACGPNSVEEPLGTVLTRDHRAVADPFLVKLRGTNNAADIDKPAPTVTAQGGHLGVAQPYLVNTAHADVGTDVGASRARSVDEPLPTVTGGHRGEWAMCEPFIIPQQSNPTPKSIDDPLPTVVAEGSGHKLAIPFILQQQSGGTGRSVDDPLPTVATDGAHALIEPHLTKIPGDAFIVPQFGEREGQEPRCHSIDNPVPAVTSHGAGALVQPYVIPIDNASSAGGARSVDEPLSTVIAHDQRHGLVEPYLVKFYGTAGAESINDPLATVTAKDRFGLCMPMVEINGERYLVDIHFRMLQPHELARAQGFPDDYKFSGNRESVVKQIGNAVTCGLSRALIKAVVSQNPDVSESEPTEKLAA